MLFFVFVQVDVTELYFKPEVGESFFYIKSDIRHFSHSPKAVAEYRNSIGSAHL